MLQEDWTTAKTFELYGPKQYSTKEISELVDREIIKSRRHVNVPKRILKPAAYWMNRLIWWPTMSADEVEMEFIDQKIDPSAHTLKDLNIEPADLHAWTFHYLVCCILIGLQTRSNCLCSKGTEAPSTPTCRLRPNASREKKRNTSMSLTTNKFLHIPHVLYIHLLDATISLCFHPHLNDCHRAKHGLRYSRHVQYVSNGHVIPINWICNIGITRNNNAHIALNCDDIISLSDPI